MWKSVVVSFSYIILIGCMEKNTETNNELVKNPKSRKKDLLALQEIKNKAQEEAYKIAKQTASNAINQAIEDMQKQFASLSQEQIQAIKKIALETATATAIETANQIAENTAKNIASDTTNQAVENMQKQFASLSELQIQVIKTATLEIANQIAENTAKNIAFDITNQAVENMQKQFASLSQEQIQAIKKIALETATATAIETANQIAENTAQNIASDTTNQAIENMQKQFASLSQTQIQVIKETALETANQIAENTAQNIASDITNQAVENMQKQFASLSQEQIQAIKKIALETATATAIETANQIAENTAQNIASDTTNQAVENMQKQFASLSQTQIQVIKETALETANQIAENTAQNIASDITNQAVENMQKQFASLSQEQIQAIKKIALETATATAIETANQIAENTAQNIASDTTNQAIENMQKQFASLSQEQIQAIKSATLEVASATAREVADNILEDMVKQTTFAVTDRAIQEMEDTHSNLLKAGLRTIISAAIESATASILKSIDDTAKEEAIDTATTVAVEVAKEIIALDDDNQNPDPGYLKRQFFNLSFEQCDWKNKEYTTRLVQDHSFFPLSDPLKSMLESWDRFKTENDTEKMQEEMLNCSNPSHSESESPMRSSENSSSACTEDTASEKISGEFAYLSPLYDDFILSFFQESIKDTYFSENDVPLECFFAGAIRGAGIYDPGRSFYYCEKDANRPGNMSVTDDNKNARKILPRRACLNKDYIYLTARAFNKTADCFGFDKPEKEELFKLFNHESSFLHNIKSPTDAKCYGQLTTGTIKEINKQIYFRDISSPFPYSYIFDEVTEKCPGLQNAVLNPKIYKSIKQTGGKSIKKFNAIISQSPITCKITQNPYSCLFYAFYNFKKNSDEIEKQLKKSTSSFSKTNSIPKEFKDKFFLPISLNTMVGVTNAKGRDMIFWDDSELWPIVKNLSSDSLSNIRQLSLFENEEEVQKLFNLWTYNGGISISKKYMIRFIKQLKRSIAVSCSTHSKTKICQYRLSVTKGQGISTADIKKDFQIYIQKNYHLEKHEKKKRRTEVTHFTSHVKKSLDYLYNKNGPFRVHLKNLVPELENHEIESFQDHLKEICPKP